MVIFNFKTYKNEKNPILMYFAAFEKGKSKKRNFYLK
jgi:hypothetical protein